MVEKHVSLTGN